MEDALRRAQSEDLTARARIRDSALDLFAARGIEGATIRDIARGAGVSGGLVRHHFGSKEGLRAACDVFALDNLLRLKEQAVLPGEIVEGAFLSSAQPALLRLFRYLARSMMDGSPSAAVMFDKMVDVGESWLTEHKGAQFPDPRPCAAVLVAMEIGVLLMQDQLSRTLGGDIFGHQGHVRLARARIDLYSDPLLDASLADRARTAIDGVSDRSPNPRKDGPQRAGRRPPSGNRRSTSSGSGSSRRTKE